MAEASADTSIVTKTSEKISEAAAGVSQAVSGTVEKGKEFVGNYGITIFLSIVIAAFLFFTAYLMYSYISSVISNKITWVVPDTKVPSLGNIYTRASGDGIPTTLNGRRMTFSMWIYIHDLSKYEGSYRHVLHRGDEDPIGASPMVMMDPKLNKLYIRFASLDKDDTTGNKSWSDIILQSKKSIAYPSGCAAATCNAAETTNINNVTDSDALAKDLASHGIIVDYVPLQRWVHIAVVVNETINRGNIYLYMDGELVKTVDSSESFRLSNGTSINYSFKDLHLAKKGDLWIGGTASAKSDVGFAGLVGKVGFANYDMNAREVYTEYLKGPIDNLTSKLGLPAYGLRTPIYRIG